MRRERKKQQASNDKNFKFVKPEQVPFPSLDRLAFPPLILSL